MKFPISQRDLSLLTMICLASILFFTITCFSHAAIIKDEIITQTVSALLERDKWTPDKRVDVYTSQGIVTLVGRIDNQVMRRRASELVLTIKGVRSVINRIEIFPIGRMDAAIEKDIYTAIETKSHGLRIDARNGYVFVSGKVSSQDVKENLIKQTMGIRGVKMVIPNIEIKPHPVLTDEAIESNIQQRLSWNVWVNRRRIDVEVSNGNVYLKGSVGSLAEKMAAMHEARMADGTITVDGNHLVVDWTLHNDQYRHTQIVLKTDDTIKNAIQDTFAHDPRFATLKARISVKNRIVRLNGTVDNPNVKRFAQEDAENTAGVRIVENNLKIEYRESLDFSGL
jgi:osmotically-inducible protein OsmY